MATTDQLQKASMRGGRPALNDFSRARYISELEAAGETGVRSLTKVQAFARIRELGIKIIPDWKKA